ncbi:hypothetical protein [Actinomadura yumaensis]|uniref:DUF4179 domain-containing protein n=1 Tax=Actinomadura yumaensis TaxID=111807 RepID=A0ABW2CTP1_9ACTN
MTVPVDELVARLARVRDEEVGTAPGGPGGRGLLAEIIAAAPLLEARRTRRRARRFALASAATAALAAAALIGVNVAAPERLRSYANAAVEIQRTDGVYEVSVKDAYAEQRRFTEAFRKMGLNVRLSIVPVTPGSERTIVAMGGESASRHGGPTVWSFDDGCRARSGACPLRVRISGEVGRDRLWLELGREARPGEPYANAHWGRKDPALARLGLPRRTVAGAVAVLRRAGLKADYAIGTVNPDGSGGMYRAAPSWRPAGGRRVGTAWTHSSTTVTLMVLPAPGDPRPDPAQNP